MIACGESHTLILMENGAMKSCGSNAHGQLGHEEGNTRPGTAYIHVFHDLYTGKHYPVSDSVLVHVPDRL